MPAGSHSGRRRLLGLAVVVVALAGLFAMHGLSTHGVADPPAPGMSMHADHGGDPSDGGLPGDDHQHDVLLLCLALLAAGVVVLAVRRGWVRWPTRKVSTARSLTTPRAARRDRDPPDLRALSIQRC